MGLDVLERSVIRRFRSWKVPQLGGTASTRFRHKADEGVGGGGVFPSWIDLAAPKLACLLLVQTSTYASLSTTSTLVRIVSLSRSDLLYKH